MYSIVVTGQVSLPNLTSSYNGKNVTGNSYNGPRPSRVYIVEHTFFFPAIRQRVFSTYTYKIQVYCNWLHVVGLL